MSGGGGGGGGGGERGCCVGGASASNCAAPVGWLLGAVGVLLHSAVGVFVCVLCPPQLLPARPPCPHGSPSTRTRTGCPCCACCAPAVPADLDCGPIIAQDVTHVTHRDSVPDMVRKVGAARCLLRADYWALPYAFHHPPCPPLHAGAGPGAHRAGQGGAVAPVRPSDCAQQQDRGV